MSAASAEQKYPKCEKCGRYWTPHNEHHEAGAKAERFLLRMDGNDTFSITLCPPCQCRLKGLAGLELVEGWRQP